jgi:hypothetical protein
VGCSAAGTIATSRHGPATMEQIAEAWRALPDAGFPGLCGITSSYAGVVLGLVRYRPQIHHGTV